MMELFGPELLVAAISAIGGGGVVWGATRTRLSKVEDYTKDVDSRLKQHTDEDHVMHVEIVQRLTRMESKVDQIIERGPHDQGSR